MDESKFDQWIEKILATEEEEISCSVCFDLVSDFVEAELAGKEISGAFQKVKQHIHQCQVCREEYELLRDFITMDVDE